MAAWLFPAISTAISLGSTLFGGSQKPPDFQLSASDINKLIDAYRREGMEGIARLGRDERQRATSRLAASGMEPTLAMQQALYNPILEQLGGARAQLEGRLAGAEGNLQLQRAYGQQRADMAGFENQQNFLAGLGDLAGTAALYGYGQLGNQGFDYDLWNQQAVQRGDYNRYVYKP